MVNEKRLIDANALFEFLKEQREKETGNYSKGRNNGINVAIGAIRNEQICPTIDAVEVVHKNRLTLDELMELDCPVWCSCKTFDGKSGFWCLCQNGIITAPSCRSFDCREIPQWKFYLCKVDLEG